MDLDAYVAEHRGEWQRLATLSRRRTLNGAEVDELVLLYQRVATQLSVVRSRTPDPSLVAELSRLVLSARSALTGPSKADWSVLPRFFARDLPQALYAARRWWIFAGLGFWLVSGVLMAAVAQDPGMALDLGMSQGQIDYLVSRGFEEYYHEYFAPNFGAQVWLNNAWISAQCLASGVLILPVFYVLAQNAMNLGVVGGLMIGYGRADTFFGLIAPHGFLELTAVFVAAGVGLRIGWSWIAPGPVLTRAQSLTAAVRQGMTVALGLVVILLVSGCLEAFVTPSPLPLLVRDAVGFAVWLLFLGYVWGLGRPRAEEKESELAGGLERQVAVADL